MNGLACLVGLALAASVSATALAAEDGVDEAKTQFAAGSTHLQNRRWQDALRAFERANALVESPNTELLIGRCLRELGRPVDAAKAFEQAARHAKRRVHAGETKYQQAGEAAEREAEAIRRTLGTIHVRVAKATAEGVLSVDGTPLPVDADGSATVLSRPGIATIEFHDRNRVQRQTVTTLAGGIVEVEFGEVAPAPPDPDRTVLPSAPPARRPSWPFWAAIGAGAVTAAGAGIYFGFDAAAQSTYDDLAARCGPDRCTDADRPEADRGERQQTVAIVGLSIAVVAAAATVVFAVMSSGRAGPTSAHSRTASAIVAW